jgi:hypothetical protein
MGNKAISSALLVLALSLTGCTAETTPGEADGGSEPLPTIDQALIPQEAPADVVEVDSDLFLVEYGEYRDVIFKVGNGPTWCAISEFDDMAICEHKETEVRYEPLPIPADCNFTYGNQIKLLGSAVTGEKTADFTCANSPYSDATTSPVLADGEQITAFGFSCFVQGETARCENSTGDFIVLGPDAWAKSD